jgi:hypothetical protein
MKIEWWDFVDSLGSDNGRCNQNCTAGIDAKFQRRALKKPRDSQCGVVVRGQLVQSARRGRGARLRSGHENLAGEEEGPERKFSSFAAVRTRGLPWSVNLRSGQRDYHIYIAGGSIRP